MQALSPILIIILLSSQAFPLATSSALRSDDTEVVDQDDQDQATGDDLVLADDLGIPSAEPSEIEAKEGDLNQRLSIMKTLTQPLLTLAKYKAKIVKDLFMLPGRAIAAPLNFISQTAQAMKSPFDAKKWFQFSSDLSRASAPTEPATPTTTSTTEKPPVLPIPSPKKSSFLWQ